MDNVDEGKLRFIPVETKQQGVWLNKQVEEKQTDVCNQFQSYAHMFLLNGMCSLVERRIKAKCILRLQTKKQSFAS